MADGGLTAFEQAVRGALDSLGRDALEKPKWFIGAVADLYDPDSHEMTVLYAHCGEELLWPFAKAAEAGATDALGRAARRAELWLRDVRRVNAKDAHVVAWAIAGALGWTGADAVGNAFSSQDPSQVFLRRSSGVSDALPYPRVIGVSPRSHVADYSWAQLKAIARAIAAAEGDEEGFSIAKKYHLVSTDGKLQGDARPVSLKDGTLAHVRILGFRHDELADGGRAGITFEFADVSTTRRMNTENTNGGGWEASEMRAWLNSDFLALLPEDLRVCEEAVRKRTNNRGHVEKEGDTSVVTPTFDKLWLLSVGEVYGEVPSVWYSSATYDAEGTQYQLYADQCVITSDYGFCKKDGAVSWWWLRSPSAYNGSVFHHVSSDGDWFGSFAGCVDGVSPGFCF